MNKIYIKDVFFNNETYKIYNLEPTVCIQYFNTSINGFNNIQPTDNINLLSDNLQLKYIKYDINLAPIFKNAHYMNLSNEILYSKINEKNPKFLNVIDNTFYEVYNVIFNWRDSPVILYYCNRNDPFIVVQTSSYMDFQYIIYINNKEIINISENTSAHDYYFNEIFNSITSTNLNCSNKIEFEKYLYFGFNLNTGHHLWNEISGLYYFLQNKSYHDKINGIIIGPYDWFNIAEFLKKNYNFNIINFEDKFGKCKHLKPINLNNAFPIFLNNYYIDNNISNTFFPIIVNTDSVVKEETELLELSFEIRSNRRVLKNSDFFYINLIEKLLNDYKNYKLKINIVGCFETTVHIIDVNTNEEYIEQNVIANNIIQHFYHNKNIIFENLVGKKFLDIKNDIINSKLSIQIAGTGVVNLMTWIFNTKAILIGTKESFGWLSISHTLLDKYNIIPCPIECITLSDGRLQGIFDLDYKLFYNFFKNTLDTLILE